MDLLDQNICEFFLPSVQHLFQIPKIFRIPDDDPASHLLRHLDEYLQRNDSETIKTLRNINAFTLDLKREDFENKTKVNGFLKGVIEDFDHILIAEHLDESLVVMRRRLCWEISDIVYFPLRVKNYWLCSHVPFS